LLGYLCVQDPPRAIRVAQPHVVSAVLELRGNGTEIVGPAGTRTPLGSLGLRPGGRVLAGSSGGATVQLSTGTRTAIEHDTSLEFENAGPDERFFLATVVRPGESWPGHRGVALPVATPPAQVEHVVAHGVAPKPLEPASVAAKGSGQEHASSIAQQNELFSEAIVARRLGDNAAAVGSFELFVARYPESPLAESAAVHRLGLLRRLDPVAARSAARSYLARYPSGYARHDAEQLISLH
jgi:hypothetical protein